MGRATHTRSHRYPYCPVDRTNALASEQTRQQIPELHLFAGLCRRGQSNLARSPPRWRLLSPSLGDSHASERRPLAGTIGATTHQCGRFVSRRRRPPSELHCNKHTHTSQNRPARRGDGGLHSSLIETIYLHGRAPPRQWRRPSALPSRCPHSHSSARRRL
jgi:hypothetical protein